jgi:hypothetical protein
MQAREIVGQIVFERHLRKPPRRIEVNVFLFGLMCR